MVVKEMEFSRTEITRKSAKLLSVRLISTFDLLIMQSLKWKFTCKTKFHLYPHEVEFNFSFHFNIEIIIKSILGIDT